MIRKLTPVLFVEKIEPVLPFWTEHLGFIKTVEAPEGDRLGFVILQQGTTEVMYQTYASVEKDFPSILPDARKGPTFLYIEVDNLNALKPALASADVYMPERTTFYGSREIGVRDAAGHFITFAEFAAAKQNA
ncbi:MAG TPA: VOC family protein [Candidatus Acidoferrum sp.]|nr:VOC family protein [Candidatus Acidoferrum sp.]